MSLLTLPAELRLRIYDYLPELQINRTENVTAFSKLTPSICQVNNLLRRETLCLFATNSNFTIAMDDGGPFWHGRVQLWMKTLGPELLVRVRSLQLGRHWAIPLPFRYQGHIGFYVKIERQSTSSLHDQVSHRRSYATDQLLCWAGTNNVPMLRESRGVIIGTYPAANDSRKARLDSVQLLANTIRHRLATCVKGEGLGPDDVDFMIRAMGVVALPAMLKWDEELQRPLHVS